MKKILVLLLLNFALLAVAQNYAGHFDRVFVTSHGGEQIELHDVTLRYLRKGLLAEPGPVSYINGVSEAIQWSDVLAITAAPVDEMIGWYIVLTNGQVLPGLHGDLYIEGTRVNQIEPQDASPSFEATITSYDPHGLDYVSVVIPNNLDP